MVCTAVFHVGSHETGSYMDLDNENVKNVKHLLDLETTITPNTNDFLRVEKTDKSGIR